jgi:hypothetical protein
MMRVLLYVPDYDPAEGIRTEWDDGFAIDAQINGGAAHIVANPAGLRSLARHLLVLAGDNVPAGSHVHLDASSCLEDGSCELILERGA